jgi:hypothetical protein
VLGAEVLIEGAVPEHGVNGGQDRGGDGTDGLFGPAPVAQSLELRLQIAGLLAARGLGTLHQGGLQPGRSLAQPGEASLFGWPSIKACRMAWPLTPITWLSTIGSAG